MTEKKQKTKILDVAREIVASNLSDEEEELRKIFRSNELRILANHLVQINEFVDKRINLSQMIYDATVNDPNEKDNTLQAEAELHVLKLIQQKIEEYADEESFR